MITLPLSPCVDSLPLTIRPVQTDDLEAVLDVYRQCEDFLMLGPQPYSSMDMVLADLHRSHEEGGIYSGIIERSEASHSERLIGVIDYMPSGFEGFAGQAFISLMMIAAPHRSRGVGTAVFHWVEAEVRKNPAASLLAAGVQINNPAALRFWLRMGFHAASAPENLPDGTVGCRLEKRLR